MKYGLDMTLKQLCEDEGALALFDRELPGMSAQLSDNPMAKGLSLRKLLHYAAAAFPQEFLEGLDLQLKEYGKTAEFTPTEKNKIVLYQEIAEADRQRHTVQKPADTVYDAIYPGRPWLDTNGKRIQAHGGAILYEDGTYYWYGENKEHTDGKGSIWTWGIRAYRSADFYNWEDMGLIIEPVLDNPNSNLFPDMRVDRPHIRKCAATGKYVAWIKLSGEKACFLVMQADRFIGPYVTVKEDYCPLGYRVGDFDIAQDETTGKSYLFMDADHQGVICVEMAEDMLSAEKKVSVQYTGMFPPFCREGIAVFERKGKKYMLTSGMTGYLPNQSDAAVSDAWTDPFVPVGDPYLNDGTGASCNSQFTQVFKIPNRDIYVALADRWVPNYPIDREKADLIRRCVASRYDPEHYHASEEEQAEMAKAPMLESADTSIADYVWLPLCFEGDRVYIQWKENWKLEDYE